MEDEFLAGSLIKLIDSHFIIHRMMRRHLPDPDKDGLETLLRNMTESLTYISTYKEFYHASDQLSGLSTRVLDAIDELIDSETPP